MTISLNTNLNALRSQRALADSQRVVGRVYERLASGQRINRAADDSAGLAVVSSLNLNARVYGQGIRNVNDGISLINIAEGTLQQLSSTVGRLQELAQQAASGSYSLGQRRALQSEADQLTKEFNRQLTASKFNGRSLLDGTFGALSLQAGFGLDAVLSTVLGGSLGRTVGSGLFRDGAFVDGGETIPQIVEADLNGDGFLDLITGGAASFSTYLNDGSGNLTLSDSESGAADFIAVGDFNGDGLIDIARSKNSGAAAIYSGNGAGGFSLSYARNFGSVINGLKVADVNGDGVDDLLASSTTQVSGFLGTGSVLSASATTLVNYLGGGSLTDFEVGDLDGDGDGDIVVGSSTGQVTTYLRQLVGTYSQSSAITLSNAVTDLAIGDLNRDGINDFAVVHNKTLWTASGNGLGGWTSSAEVQARGGRIRLQDINGDGILDAVTSASGDLAVNFGSAEGTFSGPSTLQSTTAYSGDDVSFGLGDFNGDGLIDVATSNNRRLGIQLGVGTTSTQATFLDLLTQSGARSAIDILAALSRRILGEQGALGAIQSRLQISSSVLEVARDNFLAAASRISDVDVASESATLVQKQILLQAGAGVLAQANLEPTLVLRLLAV